MRLAQGAKPEPEPHVEELPFGSIHRNRSLIVTPFGSRTLTFDVKVSWGKVKISTLPDVSGIRDGSGATTLLQVPTVELQFPDSSKVSVKARAGAAAQMAIALANIT